MSSIFSRTLLALLLSALVACEKVPLLAPSGSTLTLTVNTTALPLNGTAQITAVVVEAAGTAPHNGTLVTFTSSLGSIEPREARTSNGLATATFTAGGTSGTARIGAISGEASAEIVEVAIGGAAANAIALRTEAGAGASGTIGLVATVVDEGGNPLRGVVVAFSTTNGILSAGSALTDNNGEARTTLTTFGTATVTARIGQTTTELTITLGSVTLAATTTAPEVNTPVNFTVTPTEGASLREVIVDFGDGTAPVNLGPVNAVRGVSHIYRQRGSYTVTARATSSTGNTSTSSVVVTVNEAAPVAVTLTGTPNPVSLATQQGLVAFTSSATAPTGESVTSFDWSFGDGGGAVTTGGTTTYRYSTPGTYTVSVVVRSTTGRDGLAQTIIRVVP